MINDKRDKQDFIIGCKTEPPEMKCNFTFQTNASRPCRNNDLVNGVPRCESK